MVADPGFCAPGLDRADLLRSDPDGLRAAMMRPSARLLRMTGLDPDIAEDGGLAWGSLAEADPEAELLLLGLDGAAPRFVAVGHAPGPGQPIPLLWQALAALPERDAAIYAAARSLVDWHARHRFCARCGSETASEKAGWARCCPNCHAEHFPRTDPVVIMLAEHGGRVLLGRQPQYPPRRLSALAGFVEPGETFEGAVARELHEEAGIRVSNIRYIKSQPWPFPSSLMIGCFADAEDDALTIDTTELEEAIWVDEAGVRAAMAGEPDAPFIAPPRLAIAHHLLAIWLELQD
ncbi:NAD(+) diphosphatase [Novosphingopyxis sp.]|uniref:NAD(+) diphosphatase n=1 Tax=Novosphingopyxis sp. TaxID=2709690 RepID=UPI003B5BB229